MTWLQRLTRQLGVPTVAVDTTCLVPTGSDRVAAFFDANDPSESYRRVDYQSAMSDCYDAAIGSDYLSATPEALPSSMMTDDVLPVQTDAIDWSDLAGLIGLCRIDHSIPPVAGATGGGRAADRLWRRLVESGLEAAAGSAAGRLEERSRLSAYVHYGMISPFRVAREAAAIGADEFLHRFLYWRELAFHFCTRFAMNLDSLDRIPNWARQSLRQQAEVGDEPEVPRPAPPSDVALPDKPSCPSCPSFPSWETMLRGKTSDARFNALQRRLARRGALPSDQRTVWGKSILPLSPGPHAALQRMIDLNHRLSLDGRDPSSYGGILWCLGQFDDPQNDVTPVFGSVRAIASTEILTEALTDDPSEILMRSDSKVGGDEVTDSDLRRGQQSGLPGGCRVAVIGAGVGGLIASRILQDAGLEVTIFEKSRGVGGRLATRRHDDLPGGPTTFDHGAQYFTARDERFLRYVDSWTEDGIASPWDGRIVKIDRVGEAEGRRVEPVSSRTTRYVGTPSNNAVAKHLASDLSVVRQTRIVSVRKVGSGDQSVELLVAHPGVPAAQHRWQLIDQDGTEHGPFDYVISNLPPPQAAALVPQEVSWASELSEFEMLPCITLMIRGEVAETNFEGAFVNDHPLSWIARDDRKPGRVGGGDKKLSSWVVQASPDWSAEHFEDDVENLREMMTRQFGEVIGQPVESVVLSQIQKWRYSMSRAEPEMEQREFLLDADAGWAACGDWLCGGRVEGAFLSGAAVAGALMRYLVVDRGAVEKDQE